MKPGPRSLAAEEKIFLGFQHHQAGRLTEAETLYREALQVEPNNAEVIHFLGVIGLQTGRTTDAIPWLEHAVRLQASNPNFQNDLGLGYLRLGRSVDSEHCFRRAIEIAPDYVDAHNNLGLVSLASGSLESAERSFRKAIALEPGYGTAYINLGGVLRRLGKLDEAREVCNRAVTLSPARAEAHNNLGNVLKELGSPKDAERSYRKAVSLKPSYPEALRSLGLVLRDMGRSDEAERLEHVSGLSNAGGDPMFMNTSMDHAQLISWVLNDPAHKMTRDANTQYEYLNFGYCLLGRVIEKVTGKPYDASVQQIVLAPSGVTEMAIAGNAAADKRPREVAYYPSEAYSLNVKRFDSHGGWIASPIDLVRYVVRVDGLATKPDIITAQSHATMLTAPHIMDAAGKDPNYGFGWGLPQWHNGDIVGTIAFLEVLPGGYTYAVLANTRPAKDTGAFALSAVVKKIITSVGTWPAYDLF